jgi:hypothetical protein
MGYALFAQRKVQLTGNLNTVSLMQTQRSNEQYALATHTLSLNQELSSLQVSQSKELTDLYELLAHSTEDGMEDNYLTEMIDDGHGKQVQRQTTFSASTKKFLSTNGNPSRQQIQAEIEKKELEHQQAQEAINRKIYLVSVKENAIEMEVKRLDTQISAIQQQLKAVEEAEGSAIERATPKFNGVG